MTDDGQTTSQGFETLALHAGQEPDPTTNSRAVPIYQTTSYVFNDAEHAANLFALKEFGNIYTRIMNPTTDVFEKRVAALEGGVGALGFASGSGGDHLRDPQHRRRRRRDRLRQQPLRRHLQPVRPHVAALGHRSRPGRSDRPRGFRRAHHAEHQGGLRRDDRQPEARRARHRKVAAIAHDAGVPLIVDNTMPTPYLLRPIEHGADIVVHSATKFIGGHGTSIGGVIVDGGKFDWAQNDKFPGLTEPDPSYHGLKFVEALGPLAYIIKLRVSLLRDVGAALSPFNAFLFLQGLETLAAAAWRALRQRAGCREHLEAHDKVGWVTYPGLASCCATSSRRSTTSAACTAPCSASASRAARGRAPVHRGHEAALAPGEHRRRQVARHPPGDHHALAAARLRSRSTGVTDDFVRLSIGLETIDDILADLDQALAGS